MIDEDRTTMNYCNWSHFRNQQIFLIVKKKTNIAVLKLVHNHNWITLTWLMDRLSKTCNTIINRNICTKLDRRGDYMGL